MPTLEHLLAALGDRSHNRKNIMKIKALFFVTCLAAGALIASPALSKPVKKTEGSSSKQQQTAKRTTQVTPGDRYVKHRQNVNSQIGNTRYYGGRLYSGTRSYAGPQYNGTRYYNVTPLYGTSYYGGTRYYYGSGSNPYYSYYSGWPTSNWGPSSGYYPYSYWGGYPNTYSNNYYSYYAPSYSYNASLVAAVQQHLRQLGYYHAVVDGVIGPQTRDAIAAFEARNGLLVDGRISRPLLDSLRLG
jgi:hypothetical protein